VWVCQEDDGLDIVGDAHSNADVHSTTVCKVVAPEGEYDEWCGVGPYFIFDIMAGI
jgi:hypothetical protein